MFGEQKYWKRDVDFKKFAGDLTWNFPEQKAGEILILGGNSQNFMTEVKITEFLTKKFSFLNEVRNYFPDSLKSSLPLLSTIDFFSSTESGSFANLPEFTNSLKGKNKKFSAAIFSGDFSKNSATVIAVCELIKNSPEMPTILARDTVDLVSGEMASFIERDNLTLVASMSQLQKVFRGLYYPKMLLLSQPIFPIVETLHKFTLSFPVSILTFHEGKILACRGGEVFSIDIEKTAYSPITLWGGEVAARIAVYSMFNPGQELNALAAAVSD